MAKNKRPKIPDPIKLKLWVTSGGRCEFPGCNKIVWRDGLTLKEDNFAHMAHLVAASPNGPRGDATLSPKLAEDFSNLMLVCFDHSKLIDGKNKSDFTLDYLRTYKKKHEERIHMQTAVSPDMASTVVRFMANIGERPVDISLSQAYQAIFPRFPLDEKGILLDFTNKQGRGGRSFWKEFANDIATQIKTSFSLGNDRKRLEHLSIFALAPMPLLMHFGNKIGNMIASDIYQKHRDTNDWNWKKEPRVDKFSYIVKRPTGKNKSKKITLIISLSGKILLNEVKKIIPDAHSVYEITIKNPSVEFLKHKSRLEKFRKEYRNLITEIREKHGAGCEIHLFPAVPAPIAVMCGRELLPKIDPKILVYDNDKEKSGFVFTIKIN